VGREGLQRLPGRGPHRLGRARRHRAGEGRRATAPLRIDQGEADKFLAEQLHPHLFEAACRDAGQPLQLHRHAGYDHGYFFISSFVEDHLRHHALTVATGKSRRGLDEALQTVELQGVFDGSRTADETAGKPSPLMLHELMREFGVEPERTLMIGDTTHDLQMAVNAGCASVGVSYGAHEPQAFAALQPLHVAHSVRELHNWLDDHA
jgi:beta-phosphoglucomutase-like phosphatase (HAD superfamily)